MKKPALFHLEQGFSLLVIIIILALVSTAAFLFYRQFGSNLSISSTKPNKVYQIIAFNPNKKAFTELEKGFTDGLKNLGYIQGQNLNYTSLETNTGQADFQKQLDSAINAKPDLLVGFTNEAIVPIYKAEIASKTNIPLLASSPFDVKELGITNYNGSGNFVAAVTAGGPELNKKRLQVVKQVLPNAKTVAIITNPKQPNYNGSIDPLRDVAPGLGMSIVEYQVTTQAELDQLLNTIKKGDADILMTAAQILFVNNVNKIYDTATNKGIPTLDFRLTSTDHVLITYGHIFSDLGAQSAIMADKILKGSSPGSIPVEEPRKVIYAINLKIASRLGVNVPDSILSQADKIIK
ncbi:ABC transporter substrate-binding protein [Candidatus Daviesbacteria bacterium]|nr:ABC transporter substrate-binding protein [Candidatus Daviesbacteria bacterium]